ncbi:MAG: AmmeMemoRadiSam system protein A [Candidatus Shapirobacteria bacterium]
MLATAAATQDNRFSPVKIAELPELKIEISVLSPKKKISDWREIVLGYDGVVIENQNRSGTFLPQAATEANWTLEKFLIELCTQKAGLPANCYLDPQANIYTFQAQIFSEP